MSFFFAQDVSYKHIKREYAINLTRRSRITNLGVLVLICISAASIILNLLSFSRGAKHSTAYHGSKNSILATLGKQSQFKELDHLIMVPGHAIWNDGDPLKVLNDDEWLLEDYQRGGGRVAAFVAHVRTACDMLIKDEHALLVFSG